MGISAADPTDSIGFTAEPDTAGFPAVVDAAFRDAVGESKQGGDDTQRYFDALIQTSDFWGEVASGGAQIELGEKRERRLCRFMGVSSTTARSDDPELGAGAFCRAL